MKLPLGYRWLKAQGFTGFIPWHLVAPQAREGLRKEYQLETGKDFSPFASRQDMDDVAGFEVLEGEIQERVIHVHLTWTGRRESKGFPSQTTYTNIFEWLKQEVIPETMEWMSEEELEDLEEYERENP